MRSKLVVLLVFPHFESVNVNENYSEGTYMNVMTIFVFIVFFHFTIVANTP